jgi:hypothetical protein
MLMPLACVCVCANGAARKEGKKERAVDRRMRKDRSRKKARRWAGERKKQRKGGERNRRAWQEGMAAW